MITNYILILISIYEDNNISFGLGHLRILNEFNSTLSN